jgi:hypothetical protein
VHVCVCGAAFMRNTQFITILNIYAAAAQTIIQVHKGVSLINLREAFKITI